ncbi:MAG: hypothetical protein QF926_15265 [Alphaproteobacteria bacterium]|jgi:hypothetical protein|nr:hypothetical protein [Alphaproteobacteria bacterium]MDP6517963.1 hypothetical protein [Alphaproteobacteria bacterium]
MDLTDNIADERPTFTAALECGAGPRRDREFVPVRKSQYIISLGEVRTPLIRASGLVAEGADRAGWFDAKTVDVRSLGRRVVITRPSYRPKNGCGEDGSRAVSEYRKIRFDLAVVGVLIVESSTI